MIQYIIIDDEPIAHRIIERYCKNLPHLSKVGNCFNAFEAMELLSTTHADLLFLDINMPTISGFEFLKTLVNPPKIIVTTAYKEFAIEGYELNISDYLLKPFSFERFVKAINKTKSTMAQPNFSQPNHASQNSTSIFVKGDKTQHQVHLDTILYIQAYGNYTKIHTENNLIVSHQKISDFTNSLPRELFLRVHKSYMVSIKKIDQIVGNRIIISNHKIPIGQTYKVQIKNLSTK